ncbi:hypothetical protein [Roseomonas sp. WA12]
MGGRPIALFGFAPTPHTDTACCWMLASEDASTTHGKWLARNTHRIVTAADHRWSRFVNFVDARNGVHVRWLRWAGFTLEPATPHGPQGLPFHFFHRTAPHV